MALRLLESPAARLVDLDEMKRHLNVDTSDDDQTIISFIRAAEGRLDGPRGILGRAIRPQRWEMTAGRFGASITVPLPPTISVDAITYLDSNGDEQTFPETDNWRVIGIGNDQGAMIVPFSGVSWPSLYATADPDLVRVIFTAGYYNPGSPDDNAIPEELKQACKLMVGDWYEHRNSSVIGTSAAMLPLGVEMLIAPYRVAGVYMAICNAA